MLITNRNNQANNELIAALERKVIWSSEVSVSSSGKTRKLKFYTITNNDINDITMLIAQMLQLNYTNGCISIKGEGMHMGVLVVQKVSSCLFDDIYSIKHKDL